MGSISVRLGGRTVFNSSYMATLLLLMKQKMQSRGKRVISDGYEHTKSSSKRLPLQRDSLADARYEVDRTSDSLIVLQAFIAPG